MRRYLQKTDLSGNTSYTIQHRRYHYIILGLADWMLLRVNRGCSYYTSALKLQQHGTYARKRQPPSRTSDKQAHGTHEGIAGASANSYRPATPHCLQIDRTLMIVLCNNLQLTAYHPSAVYTQYYNSCSYIVCESSFFRWSVSSSWVRRKPVAR